MSFTFECDCRYEAHVQLLWMRINERGQFRTIGDRIIFERPSGTLSWPYRVEQGTLWLTERPNQTYRYRHALVTGCGSGQTVPQGRRDGLLAAR